ncbi:MAG TPA: hypothetical protein VFT74_02765 [Isosphaeraceae bacterium]|nr:hypothetical protein [Isosphaeraceae bacterium]
MVRNDVTEDVLPPGAIQGRWHVRDKAAKPLPVFMPITDAGGNYREPDSGIITELWKMDLRKKDVVAAVFSRTERQQAQKRKEIDLKREQERDVLREDLRAGWRTKGRIYRDDGSFVKRKVA